MKDDWVLNPNNNMFWDKVFPQEVRFWICARCGKLYPAIGNFVRETPTGWIKCYYNDPDNILMSQRAYILCELCKYEKEIEDEK